MSEGLAGTRTVEQESSPRSWLSSIGDLKFGTLVAVPLFVLFLVTATRTIPYHIDAFTNVLTASEIGSEGSFYLDDHEHLVTPGAYRNIAWVVEARESAVSQYPPGAALVASPLYAAWPGDPELMEVRGSNNPDAGTFEVLIPPLFPAAIASSLTVAIALGALAVVFRRLGGAKAALVGVAVAGLGTAAWPVAADQLWQHGPAMMWIALGLVWATGSFLASGVAFGGAILTRPHTALIAAATGLYAAWKERRFWVAVLIGLGATAGLVALALFNNAIYGSPSVTGGYGSGFTDNAVSGDLGAFAKNVVLGLFSRTRGLFVWSPFLLVLIPGIWHAWRVAPGWAKGAAIGGVIYLLVQWKANRFSGGSGFFAYRYPLEALTAAAPLLFLAYTEWVVKRPAAARAFTWLGVLSVAAHGAAAVVA